MRELREWIRAAEAAEQKLQNELMNVERAAEACRDARIAAEAALRILPQTPTLPSASFAQRVDERRVAERRHPGLEHPEQIAV